MAFQNGTFLASFRSLNRIKELIINCFVVISTPHLVVSSLAILAKYQVKYKCFRETAE